MVKILLEKTPHWSFDRCPFISSTDKCKLSDGKDYCKCIGGYYDSMDFNFSKCPYCKSIE